MTDDVARDPAEIAAESGQGEDRPKRSRRRGRRSKNKSGDGQSAPAQEPFETSQKPADDASRSAAARGSRKSGAQKGGYAPFNDGLDRFVCTDCLRFLPLTYPVQHRRGTATIPLREVARRGQEMLLCNGLHLGPCCWPDGELFERASASPASPQVAQESWLPDEPAHPDNANPDTDFTSNQLTADAGEPAMQLTETP